MKVLYLIIKNFFSIQEGKIKFTKKGLFWIKGEKDTGGSNGVGKSTIPEAWLWCWFGQTIRGYKADEVVNQIIGKNTEVHVKHQQGKNVYIVVRYRKHHKFGNKIRIVKNGKSRMYKIGDGQRELDKIIGVSFYAFTNYVIFGQGLSRKVLRFAEMTDKEQKETLESLLPTSWIAGVCKRISENLSVLNKKEYKNRIDFDRSSSTYLELRKGELPYHFIETIQDVEDINQSITEAEHEISSLKTTKKELLTNNNELMKEIASKQSIKRHDAKRIKKQISFFKTKSRCPECLSDLSAEYRNDIVNRLRGELKDLKKEHDKIKDSQSKQDFLELQIGNIETEISELEREKNRNISSMCLQEEMNDELKRREVVLSKRKVKLKKDRKRLVVVRHELDSVRRKIKILEFWKVAFSPKGIRSRILDSVMDYFTERANEYIEVLSLGEIKLKFSTITDKGIEKFNVEVKNVSRCPDYTGNSGGERQRINLAILFAIRDVAALYTKMECNLLFLDEIFEHLDSVGVEQIQEVLLLVKKRVDSIFVISYLSGLEGIFNGSIIVKRKKNLSQLTTRGV